VKLDQRIWGADFQNPVLLAAGTCGFGEELAEVVDLERLGGFVTKSVTREPRWGNPAPRVAEFRAGMLNSIGLANPGVEVVRTHKLPWIRAHIRKAQVFVSVAGHTPREFEEIVGTLEKEEGFLGFELNLSCPNDTKRAGLPFALDPEEMQRVIEGCRRMTDRPLVAKLAPNAPDIGETAARAVDAGADGLSMVNTLPGLVFEAHDERPLLGAGRGGVSGPALLPVGVQAVWSARTRVTVPMIGAGGIVDAGDARQYFLAGASLVALGTLSFADPRGPVRVVDDLTRLGRMQGKEQLRDWIGTGRLDRDVEEPK
jgi:dihydroorotate dehydrogenase (NAD+) catalytic subunit